MEMQKTISNSTDFNDLNADCLEKIFEELSFNDLINLADISKQFHNALCRVYKKKYANMQVIFDLNYFKCGYR